MMRISSLDVWCNKVSLETFDRVCRTLPKCSVKGINVFVYNKFTGDPKWPEGKLAMQRSSQTSRTSWQNFGWQKLSRIGKRASFFTDHWWIAKGCMAQEKFAFSSQKTVDYKYTAVTITSESTSINLCIFALHLLLI